MWAQQPGGWYHQLKGSPQNPRKIYPAVSTALWAGKPTITWPWTGSRSWQLPSSSSSSSIKQTVISNPLSRQWWTSSSTKTRHRQSISNSPSFLIFHFCGMKGQTLSRYVKVKGQIIITGKKKKQHWAPSSRETDPCVCCRKCVCASGLTPRRELVHEECAVDGCEILSRLVDGLYNGLYHIHLKSPFLRCFRVTNSSTYMVIIYSHRLTPNTPSQQMM